MGERKRITLAAGVVTNEGPTGRAAAGDTIELNANIARQLITGGNAIETADPIETKAEKHERKEREKKEIEEGSEEIQKQHLTHVPTLEEVKAAGYSDEVAKAIVADQQAKADAFKENPNLTVAELEAIKAQPQENK
jgi:hypothetical protein